MPIKILIADCDQMRRNQIRDFVRELPECEIVGTVRDGEEAIQSTVQLAPDVALISYDLPGISGMQACDVINAIAPDTMVAILSDINQQSRLESAMTSGARAFICNPPDFIRINKVIHDLYEISDRRKSSKYQDWKDPNKYSKVISITAGKGGVGKTTICSNLAVTLANIYRNNVMLLDLYSQFGDISTMLNVSQKLTIADMNASSSDLDPELLRNYITEHSSGVHVLTTSNRPIPIDYININLLEDLIHILKRMYKYIIIDVPPFLFNSTIRILSISNKILLIANLMDLTAVADTRKFIDALQYEEISKEKISLIINRISKTNKLNFADVEQALSTKIIARIPEDERVVNSINEGVPLVLSYPDSQFGSSFRSLADELSVPANIVSSSCGLYNYSVEGIK